MFKVTQHGDVFHVEDTSINRVKRTFKTKEEAIQYAQSEAEQQRDYFKDVKSNITIKSIDMDI